MAYDCIIFITFVRPSRLSKPKQYLNTASSTYSRQNLNALCKSCLPSNIQNDDPRTRSRYSPRKSTNFIFLASIVLFPSNSTTPPGISLSSSRFLSRHCLMVGSLDSRMAFTLEYRILISVELGSTIPSFASDSNASMASSAYTLSGGPK